MCAPALQRQCVLRGAQWFSWVRRGGALLRPRVTTKVAPTTFFYPPKKASHTRRHERRKISRFHSRLSLNRGLFRKAGRRASASPALPDALSAPLHRAACSRRPPLSQKSCGAYSFRSSRYEIINIIAVFPLLVKARRRGGPSVLIRLFLAQQAEQGDGEKSHRRGVAWDIFLQFSLNTSQFLAKYSTPEYTVVTRITPWQI